MYFFSIQIIRFDNNNNPLQKNELFYLPIDETLTGTSTLDKNGLWEGLSIFLKAQGLGPECHIRTYSSVEDQSV